MLVAPFLFAKSGSVRLLGAIIIKKMPNSRSDLFGTSEVQQVAPPAHSDIFVTWALCIAVLAVVGIPTGILAVRRMRADRNAQLLGTEKALSGALPFRDRYVAPAQLLVRMPRQCHTQEEPANLTFDLFKQYAGTTLGGGGGLSVAGSKSATQVFCYYNKSRVSYLQGGKTWFGVASIPLHFCRYVVYGPVKVDGWTARVLPTARDVILIEQLTSTVASFGSGNTSLLVSLRGRGEFTSMRRSEGNVRYFAANLLAWTLEHGFSGVHLDWRGFDSPLCGRPGNDAALEALLRELRNLAKLNEVHFVLALSASSVPAPPGDLVDYYLLEGDRRCTDPDEAGLDSLYRKLRESDASAYSVCWTLSAAVELFEKRAIGIKGTQLRFTGLVPRSEVCDLPTSGRFRECSVGELMPRRQKGVPQVFRYRTADGVAQNVRDYAKMWKGLELRDDPACVLYLDGDLDDPDGECGDPFPLLRAIVAS
ncbi:hypothetical protein HPB50_017159 [Hyalomma asiaticum]|uniref:Uncharacterized protein n=1 Tax=Hyalomma asiaticum TaxID=266040 RepID=A0ACB7T6N1_HYAAI|nr:hypothetical protein HPB50_017159 [Hyalomma asiaticum]